MLLLNPIVSVALILAVGLGMARTVTANRHSPARSQGVHRPTKIERRVKIITGAICLAVLSACSSERGNVSPKNHREPNPPSIGFIDIPANGATVDPIVRISGWAVDECDVKSVRIYFDDELMATVPLTSARPDVDGTFPKFRKPDARHGFDTLIPARSHAGYTLIRTEAIDGKGAVSPLYSVSVKIRE
jgi:hypothetical protein